MPTIHAPPLHTTAIPYLLLRAVTMSGNCGPLCSSPTTTVANIPRLDVLISCPLSGREKSNCLTSVTKNVCISMTLLAGNEWSISFLFAFVRSQKRSLVTYANLHPMQPLGPPEKVVLYQRTSTRHTGGGCRSTLRTGYYKPRRAIQAFHSHRTIVLVGIRGHLIPRDLCSCGMTKLISTPAIPMGMWIGRTNAQVVSECGDEYACPCENG